MAEIAWRDPTTGEFDDYDLWAEILDADEMPERPAPRDLEDWMPVLTALAFNPDQPRDEKGQWAPGGSALSGPMVAGGGAGQARDALGQLPEAVLRESNAKIHISQTDEEAAKTIDDYLMKHYGFDVEGQASSLVDRERGTVFTTTKDVHAQFARTFTGRIQSPEWQEAVKELTRDPALRSKSEISSEEWFVDAFTQVFTSKPVQEIASMSNPIAWALESKPVHDLFHKWGWM